MPELSIIVPVYKAEKYLPRCIDSILAQTFRDFELILIDDGSPDNCGAICDEYAAKDSRIQVIHQENAGVSAARNAGLDIATGTYLGFVDSDDWIEPEMYETMIATAKEKQVDVVACSINYYTEDGTYLRCDHCTEAAYTGKQLLEALYDLPNPLGGGCCNKIFRFPVINLCRFPNEIAVAEDWLYLFSSFSKCSKGIKISNRLHNVTLSEKSATRNRDVMIPFKAIDSSKLMLERARKNSFELECKATNKYLDDCIRYASTIKEIGSQTKQPYRVMILRIKWRIVKIAVRAICRKLLSQSKINGYIMEMIKL